MEGFAQPKGVIFGLGCVCKKLAVMLNSIILKIDN